MRISGTKINAENFYSDIFRDKFAVIFPKLFAGQFYRDKFSAASLPIPAEILGRLFPAEWKMFFGERIACSKFRLKIGKNVAKNTMGKNVLVKNIWKLCLGKKSKI